MAVNWEEFKTNKGYAASEIARAQRKYAEYKKAGNTAAMENAHRYAQRIRELSGVTESDVQNAWKRQANPSIKKVKSSNSGSSIGNPVTPSNNFTNNNNGYRTQEIRYGQDKVPEIKPEEPYVPDENAPVGQLQSQGLTIQQVQQMINNALQNTRQQYTPQDWAQAWGQQIQGYLMPYEQSLRDLMAQMPRYQQPNQEELLQQAQQYADLQITPQQQALQRALEQAIANTEAQQKAVEAAYAGVPERTQQLLDEARRYALESAIARGAGRSGVVNWETEKRTTPIMTQAQEAEARKAAELANIAEQLGLIKSQTSEREQQLETLRGDLTRQYLQQLQNQGYIRSRDDWQAAFNAAGQLANMALGASQWNQKFALDWLPWVSLTENEFANIVEPTGEDLTNYLPTTNTTPASINNEDLVKIRQYVESLGGKVYYDPVTGEVIINGKRFKPSKVGGKITGGVSYAPKDYINQLLGVA